MGVIGEVLEFTHTDEGAFVKCDIGGEFITAEHYGPPGDDSYPLPGDFVAISASVGEGNYQVDGYWDPKNPGSSGLGERKLYSRDADGNVVGYVLLKNDGTTELSGGQDKVATEQKVADAFAVIQQAANAMAAEAATVMAPSAPALADFATALETIPLTGSSIVKIKP